MRWSPPRKPGKKGDLLQGRDLHGRYRAHNEAHDRVMRVRMESQDPNMNHRHEVLVDQPHQFESHDDQEQTEQELVTRKKTHARGQRFDGRLFGLTGTTPLHQFTSEVTPAFDL